MIPVPPSPSSSFVLCCLLPFSFSLLLSYRLPSQEKRGDYSALSNPSPFPYSLEFRPVIGRGKCGECAYRKGGNGRGRSLSFPSAA